MKYTSFYTLLFCLLSSSNTEAQQVSLFTQYTELQSFVNPANLPIDYLQYQQNSVAGLTFRKQWLRIEGSPTTALGRYEYIREGNNISIFGGFVLKDKVGPMNMTAVYGRYAYQLRPTGQGNFLVGVGLTAGVMQIAIKNDELDFLPEDILQGGRQSDLIPDIGVGINFTYYPQKGIKYYGGISAPQITRSVAKFYSETNKEFIFRRPAHLMSSLGAIIPIGQQGFLEPSIWLKYTKNNPFNVDFNIRQKFINNFWMGVGYGTSKTIHIEMGAILTKFIGLKTGLMRFGYGFDYNTSGYGSYLGTTHEINLNYGFRARRKNK
jgi:type IX secretion system PorP/SprF family membrane protein